MIKVLTEIKPKRRKMPMNQMAEGEIAFEPRKKVYVMRHGVKKLILDQRENSLLGFDSWSSSCDLLVEILLPHETITIQLSNEVIDDEVTESEENE